MMVFAKKHVAKLVFFLALVSMTFAFFVNYLYRQEVQKGRAAVEQLQLQFNPSTISVSPGDNFATGITLFPGISFNTNGYDFTVTFDPAKVQVRHIGYMLGDGVGDTDANLATVNTTGRIHVVGNISSDVGYPIVQGKTYKVVDLDLTATSSAGSIIGLDYNVPHNFRRNLGGPEDLVDAIGGELVINQSSGVPTSTPTPTCSPNIEAPCFPGGTPTPAPSGGNSTLNFKVRFQGITTKPQNISPIAVRVIVKGVGLASDITQTVQFTPADDGTWSGRATVNLPPDPVGPAPKYSIYLKGPKHLQKRICDNSPKEPAGGLYHCTRDNLALLQGVTGLDFTGILLLAGDLPITNGQQNGVIDSEDTAYIRQHFGDTNPAILSNADLNLDNNIDTQDYSLVIAALSIKYDDSVEGQ